MKPPRELYQEKNLQEQLSKEKLRKRRLAIRRIQTQEIFGQVKGKETQIKGFNLSYKNKNGIPTS